MTGKRTIERSRLTDPAGVFSLNPRGLKHRRRLLLAVLLILAGEGCGRRPAPPLPLPAPPAPSASPPSDSTPASPLELNVRIEPDTIRKGESALLTWEARHAERVTISENIGAVGISGRIRFFPEETTTYTVTAEGAGGKVEKSVTVQVVYRDVPDLGANDLRDRPWEQRFTYFVKPVFFDFDWAELTEEAKLTLEGNLRWLLLPENTQVRFLIEGHCDERGTEEYNLALGDKRAEVVRAYLAARGVDASRIVTLSLGEERPFDTRASEEAWALNRRAHFVLIQQ